MACHFSDADSQGLVEICPIIQKARLQMPTLQGRGVGIFLDRSWPIRGLAVDIYASLMGI